MSNINAGSNSKSPKRNFQIKISANFKNKTPQKIHQQFAEPNHLKGIRKPRSPIRQSQKNQNQQSERSSTTRVLNSSRSNRSQSSCRKSNSHSGISKDCSYIESIGKIVQVITQCKQKLMQVLQIYQIMASQDTDNLKCLQHNNLVSLYCQSQKKILCVSCIYGINRHRSHKVGTLKDNMKLIQEDISKLTQIINKMLVQYDQASQVCHRNTQILKKQCNKYLQKLDKQYKQKLSQLSQQYSIQKEQIKNYFTQYINNSLKIQKNIQQLRFNIWNGYSSFRVQKSSTNGVIFNHMVFVDIVQANDTLIENIIKPIKESDVEVFIRKIRQKIQKQRVI